MLASPIVPSLGKVGEGGIKIDVNDVYQNTTHKERANIPACPVFGILGAVRTLLARVGSMVLLSWMIRIGCGLIVRVLVVVCWLALIAIRRHAPLWWWWLLVGLLVGLFLLLTQLRWWCLLIELLLWWWWLVLLWWWLVWHVLVRPGISIRTLLLSAKAFISIANFAYTGSFPSMSKTKEKNKRFPSGQLTILTTHCLHLVACREAVHPVGGWARWAAAGEGLERRHVLDEAGTVRHYGPCVVVAPVVGKARGAACDVDSAACRIQAASRVEVDPWGLHVGA